MNHWWSRESADPLESLIHRAKRDAPLPRGGRADYGLISEITLLRDTWAFEIQRCMQCRRFCASTFLVVYLGCVENEAVTSKGTHPRSVRSNCLFFFSGNKNAAGGVQSLIACRSISDPVENRRKELRRISAYRIRFVFPGGGRESPRIIPLISSFVNENILYIVSSAAYNHRLASIFVITIFYILKTPRVLKRK